MPVGACGQPALSARCAGVQLGCRAACGRSRGQLRPVGGASPGGSSGRLLAHPPLCYRGFGLRPGHFDVPGAGGAGVDIGGAHREQRHKKQREPADPLGESVGSVGAAPVANVDRCRQYDAGGAKPPDQHRVPFPRREQSYVTEAPQGLSASPPGPAAALLSRSARASVTAVGRRRQPVRRAAEIVTGVLGLERDRPPESTPSGSTNWIRAAWR